MHNLELLDFLIQILIGYGDFKDRISSLKGLKEAAQFVHQNVESLTWSKIGHFVKYGQVGDHMGLAQALQLGAELKPRIQSRTFSGIPKTEEQIPIVQFEIQEKASFRHPHHFSLAKDKDYSHLF